MPNTPTVAVLPANGRLGGFLRGKGRSGLPHGFQREYSAVSVPGALKTARRDAPVMTR